jgi:hypothetical protein
MGWPAYLGTRLPVSNPPSRGIIPLRTLKRSSRLLGPAFVLALTLVACSGAKAQPKAAVAHISLRNFHIDVAGTLPAGLTDLAIYSTGPTMHELNIAKTDLGPGDLPLAADETIDDQNPHAGFTHLAEAEGIDIGQHASLTVNLTPGHYVLYCNMEGHYKAGMATEFSVH